MGFIAWTAWLCILCVLLRHGAAQITIQNSSLPPAMQDVNWQFVQDNLLQMLASVQNNQSLFIPLQAIIQGISTQLGSLQAQQMRAAARITDGISTLCINQTSYLMKNLQSPWAMAMLDSFGRQPAGVLRGNLKWLGDIDECVNAKTEAGSPLQMHGRYCKFPLPISTGDTQAVATVGGCFPNACSSNDAKNFMLSVIEEVIKVNRTDKSLTGFYVDCQPETRPLTAGSIFAIVICSVFGAAIIIGTMYDVASDAHSCLFEHFCGTEANKSRAKLGSSEVQLNHLDTSISSGIPSPEVQPAYQESQVEMISDGKFENRPPSYHANNGISEKILHKDDQREIPEGRLDFTRSRLQGDTNTSGTSKKLGRLGSLLICFSIYANGRKLLLSSTQGDTTLSCLHGIRFLSMCWVVLGHTYYFSSALMDDAVTFLGDTAHRKSFQAVSNATFSVDTFFVLSSLLVVYMMLKELEKRKGRLTARQWVFIYVHRYLRLTGVYAVILMIWICLTTYLYDGPQWWTDSNPDSACTDNWWTNLVYVNNFVETRPGVNCMGWTWYLATDMQMFLITPVITFILYHYAYVGVGITVLLTLGSVVSSVMIAKDLNYTLSLVIGFTDPLRSLDMQGKHYYKPWTRFQAYGVGIILAFIIYKLKGKHTIPKVLALMGWIIAAGSALAVLYGPFELMAGSRQFTHTYIEVAIYVGLSRLVWSMGVAWVIYVCCTGHGGWVNQLLSWKPFVPLGRLCYSAYLIHPILMFIITQGGRDVFHFDDVTMTVRFLGELVLILAVSFVASLVFEAPLLRVEKLALGGGS